MDPYAFFDQSVPGITLAAPAIDGEGEFVGAYTVDFELNILSEVSRRLAPSEHGEVFIYTAGGHLVGHPSVSVVEQHGDGAQAELVSLRDVDDPVTRQLVTHLGAGLGCEEVGQRSYSFKEGDEDYLAMVTCFDIDERDVRDHDAHRWAAAVIAPEGDFLGGVRDELARGALYSFIALITSILLALFLADRIARPLAMVSSEMDGVGRFELHERPPQTSRFSEIRAIERSLHAMKSGLRSFAAFVPKDVVRHIVESGEEAELGGELREVTLFFSDLAGFTTMSERMAPDDLVQRLGVYLDEVTRIIRDYGGTVDKFIGDAVMAFWGAPPSESGPRSRRGGMRARESKRGSQSSARSRRGRGCERPIPGSGSPPERSSWAMWAPRSE